MDDKKEVVMTDELYNARKQELLELKEALENANKRIEIKQYTLLKIKCFLDDCIDEFGMPLEMFRNAIDRIFYDYGHSAWNDAYITQFTQTETVTGHVYEAIITNDSGDEKYIKLQTS